MSFWIISFIVVICLCGGGIFYLVSSFHRMGIIQKIAEKHKFLAWLAAIVPVAAVLGFGVINFFTPVVVMIHLMAAMFLARIIGGVYSKTHKGERHTNIEAIVAVLLTAVYLSVGWYNAHTVLRTDYNFSTEKDLGSLKIAAIADSHLGITLDGDKFSAEMERIQAENPDIVFVAGDFVDDDSCRADMEKSCEALGKLKTKYGVYLIFGNHDEGYYESLRDFTFDDLCVELHKNNVNILTDETVLIDDRFYIIGRNDRSVPNRLPMDTLMKGLDESKYMIVLDHQPNDYDAEAETAADLVISGHTHGGHIYPAGYIGLITKMNDRVYGTETRNDTDFVVTSGISGWGIPFKTGTISEYLILNVEGK